MKAAICYYSYHHGNTLKVIRAMAQGRDVDLIDIANPSKTDLEGYDLIGFASGIYYGKFQTSVLQFARQYLPQGKPVFFVCTYGGSKGNGTKAIAEIAQEKDCPVLGEFGCKGYDTFGPFKLVGGIAKGHPDQKDLEEARKFYRTLQEQDISR